jgi:hypothetical protein
MITRETGDGSLSPFIWGTLSPLPFFTYKTMEEERETENRPNVIQIAKSDFLVYDIELDKTQTNMTSSRVYG